MTEPIDLPELGREALRRARAEREHREAIEELTRSLRECTDAVREFTKEIERVRMDEEPLDEWMNEA